MRSIILFVFFVAIVKICLGGKLVTGFIVTNKGDTLRGSTSFILQKQNPAGIKFTKLGDTESIYYKPDSIVAFKTTEDYLVSAKINLDMKYARGLDITENFSEKIINDTTVFLRVLVKGKLSLFLFRDMNGKDHFFLNDGNGFLELIYKTVGRKSEQYLNSYRNASSLSNKFTVNESRFKNQLKDLMPGFTSEKDKIEDTQYEENDLTKLIIEYNTEVFPKALQFSEKLFKPISNYLMAGALISTVNFTVSDINSHTEILGSSTSSVGPVLDYFFLIQLRRRSNLVNLVPEFMIRQYDFKDDYTYKFSNYHVHFGQLQLKVNVALQTQLDLNYIKPFMNAGFSVGCLAKQTNEMTVINNDPQYNTYYSRETKTKAFKDVRTLDNGFYFSAGCSNNLFLLQVRFEHTFSTIEFNGTYNTYYLMFGYKIS